MHVLLVGSGGREHALAWWCRRGREDVELIVAPGNAGTAELAENVAVDATDAVTPSTGGLVATVLGATLIGLVASGLVYGERRRRRLR